MGINSKRSRAIKLTLFEIQEGKCFYCFTEVVMESGLDSSATLDHLIPKSVGGANTRDNLVLACNRCNQAKKSRSVQEYDLEVEYKRVKSLATLGDVWPSKGG